MADLIVALTFAAAVACGAVAVVTRDPWWLAGMPVPAVALVALRNHITREH